MSSCPGSPCSCWRHCHKEPNLLAITVCKLCASNAIKKLTTFTLFLVISNFRQGLAVWYSLPGVPYSPLLLLGTWWAHISVKYKRLVKGFNLWNRYRSCLPTWLETKLNSCAFKDCTLYQVPKLTSYVALSLERFNFKSMVEMRTFVLCISREHLKTNKDSWTELKLLIVILNI